jgi:hypothetical protein
MPVADYEKVWGWDLIYEYNAARANDSLNPSIDTSVPGIGALQFGHSEINNPNPVHTVGNGEIVLGVTLPLTVVSVSVTSGVFATPVDFATGSIFELRGRYVAPAGPSNGGWAVGILARTGDARDLTTITQKVVATLQFRPGATARLNIPYGATAHTPVDLPKADYDAITNSLNPTPFTLALLVDRVMGTGTAILTVNETAFSSSFKLKDFQANSGPAITAVGTVIANATASGDSVDVHVTDFEIFLVKDIPVPEDREIVPDVFGVTEEIAAKLVTDAGFVPKFTTEAGAKGLLWVANQSPPKGSLEPIGITVSMTLRGGPIP